jgi:hypothetical protein
VLGKVLEKTTEKLIELWATAKYGTATFLFVATVGGTFLALKHLRATPADLELLRDPIFLTVTTAAAAILVVYMLWKTSSITASARIVLTVPIAAIAASLIAYVQRDDSHTFRVDLIIDEEFPVDKSLLASFLRDSEQEHFKFSLMDVSLQYHLTDHGLEYETMAKDVLPALRGDPKSNQTIFLTDRFLSGAGWSNLFYVAAPKFAIVSMYGLSPKVNA